MDQESGEKAAAPWHKRIFSSETEDFLKGMVLTLIIFAISTVFMLVPPIYLGVVLTITVGPYIAGYKGGAHTKDWKWLALLSGIIWTSIQLLIIIRAATLFSYYGQARVGAFEALLMAAMFMFNISFCAIGAKIGWEAKVSGRTKDRRRRNRSSRA